jgi:hypothetical protein
LKFSERWSWEELRHKLVVTPEEKRVILFVIAAFILGLATKCYRDTHPRPLEYIDKSRPRPALSTPQPSTALKQKRKSGQQSRP